MAARAAELGDVGASSPEHWEKPLGTRDVHVALAALAPDAATPRGGGRPGPPRAGGDPGRRGDLAPGLLPAAHRTHVVRLQGRDRAARRGRESGRRPTNRREPPIKAGEFILGYPDETGGLRARCRPRRSSAATARTSSSGSCTPASPPTASTSATRRATREEEALLGAKMVGRWQSGAPLVLSPDEDDPELGSGRRPQQRLRLHLRPARLQVPRRSPCPTRQPEGLARRTR